MASQLLCGILMHRKLTSRNDSMNMIWTPLQIIIRSHIHDIKNNSRTPAFLLGLIWRQQRQYFTFPLGGDQRPFLVVSPSFLPQLVGRLVGATPRCGAQVQAYHAR